MTAQAPTPRPARSRLRRRLLLATLAAVATLGLLEGTLAWLHPLPPSPTARWHKFLPTWCVARPGHAVWIDAGPLQGVAPGLVENAWNELGFQFPLERQRRMSPDEVRIAAVGGSTTECGALAADKRWTAVLERQLHDRLGRPVTVLNLGVSAQDTRTHLQTTSHVVTALDVDVCIYLIGANDLGLTTGTGLPLRGESCLYPRPRWTRWLQDLWQDTQLARHLTWARRASTATRTEPYFAAAAAEQAALPVCDPPMEATTEGLANYARNVTSLIGLCTAHDIQPLFVTQPTMFTATPSAAELAVYWGCHDGRRGISAANLVALLDHANEHLEATCAARGVACVDAASRMPHGFTAFYDQVHLNENGARLFAEQLLEPVSELLR